jgi:Tol biopolymer transport system component
LFIAYVSIVGCTDSTSPGPLEQIRIEALTPTSLTGTVGSEVDPVPTVRVTNLAGRPRSGIQISFVVDGGSIANTSTQTGDDGTATVGTWRLGQTAGRHTVTAQLATQTPSAMAVVFAAIAEAGPLSQIERFAGDQQFGFVGHALLHPLQVRAADAFGNGVRGVSVTFAVISGNGSLGRTTAVTDDAGIATSLWTLGAAPGAQQVRAQSEALETVFTAHACDESCPAPQLAFVRNGEITVGNLLTGEVRPLTGGGGNREMHPAWSPDGSRIAFVRDRTANGRTVLSGAELYLMNADGSNVVLRAPVFHSPAWSPDGQRLAVASGDCWYYCDIFLLSVDKDGTEPVRIASSAADPAWSPDGSRIAFVSLSGDDGYHALHVMNADGSDVTPVTVRDEGAIDHPTWSPDGRRIAFSKCIRDACNIFIVGSDGVGLVQLTTFGHALGPAWSADGARIAFNRFNSASGVGDIAYVAADGGAGLTPIYAGHSPAWRPAPRGK